LKKISKKNTGFLIVHADMPLVSKAILNIFLLRKMEINLKLIFVLIVGQAFFGKFHI